MFNRDEKKEVQRFHLHSHKSFDDSKVFYEVLATLVFLDYLEGESTTIPLIGDLKIEHETDILTKKGKECVIKATLKPSEFLKKVIGQSLDKADTEIHKMLRRNIKKHFKNMKE